MFCCCCRLNFALVFGYSVARCFSSGPHVGTGVDCQSSSCMVRSCQAQQMRQNYGRRSCMRIISKQSVSLRSIFLHVAWQSLLARLSLPWPLSSLTSIDFLFFLLVQVSTVEASLRLDSVASAGMGMSRSKMSAAIKSGLVLVNWKAATSGTTDVRGCGLAGRPARRNTVISAKY